MLKSAYTSPKIHALARRLGVPFPHALGICGLLWNFTCDHAPDGNVGKHGPEGIAIATHWDGDAEKLLAALVAVRLIDCENGNYVVHDWAQHQPQWVKNKMEKEGRTPVGPRSDPGRTPVEGGSLSISSLSVVSPSVSSLSETPSAEGPEEEASPLGRGEIETEIQACPRKAFIFRTVIPKCRPKDQPKLIAIVAKWPRGEWIYAEYQRWKAGASKAKSEPAWWAACIKNATKNGVHR